MTPVGMITALFCIFVLMVLYVVFCSEKLGVQTPSGLMVMQLRSESMADILKYSVSAPAPVDGDVVSRILTVTVNGVEQPAVPLAGNATDLGTIEAPQDAQVVLSLVDVDNAGLKSPPATLEFTAEDTIAPAQPGAFTVTLVGERVVADAPVAAAPESN